MTVTTDRPSRQVILTRIPEGVPSLDDFAVVDTMVAGPGPGQVRVRVLELSLDPYLRTAIIGRHLSRVGRSPSSRSAAPRGQRRPAARACRSVMS